MKRALRTCALVLTTFSSSHWAAAQVGVGTTTPDASAALEVRAANKGLLIPQVSLTALTDGTTIPTPATGLLVFNRNAAVSGGVGFYYNAGTPAAPSWARLSTGSAPAGNSWGLTGNAATDSTVNYLGTNDAKPMRLGVNGQEKARLHTNGALWLGGAPIGVPSYPDNHLLLGYQAGKKLPAGAYNNQFVGYQAGLQTTSNFNQFTGFQAGYSNTTGDQNYFSGLRAGYANVAGSRNHFVGYQAGLNVTTDDNHFSGYNAGRSATTGTLNHFDGHEAGQANTTGSNNYFSGYQAGYANTTANYNHFVGYRAGASTNDPGAGYNHFEGYQAGTSNTSGQINQFIGAYAGSTNTTGDANLAVGFRAGQGNATGDNNTVFGFYAIGQPASSGESRNVFVGNNAGFNNTVSDNHFVGYTAGYRNTTGTSNTFEGNKAGYNNTTGNGNAYVGYTAGYQLRGSDNTVLGNAAGSGDLAGGPILSIGQVTLVGSQAGQLNTTSGLVAVGYRAGQNTTGADNTFLGYQAGRANTGGNRNTYLGHEAGALGTGTASRYNTFVGYQAGYANNGGEANTAVGDLAGTDLTTGDNNTLVGQSAGSNMNTGARNTFVGRLSGSNTTTGTDNVLVGYATATVNVTGTGLTAVGSGAGSFNTTGYEGLNNSTALGNGAKFADDNTMTFGNTSVRQWLFGRIQVTGLGAALQVGSNSSNGNAAYLSQGGAWTNTSDVNLKENIQPVEGAQVLGLIRQLPLSRWTYKGTHGETHLGPMAQDFYRLFHLGLNDTSISTIDPAGVALAGVQELARQNDALKTENAQLRQQLQAVQGTQTALNSRLTALEQAMRPAAPAALAEAATALR